MLSEQVKARLRAAAAFGVEHPERYDQDQVLRERGDCGSIGCLAGNLVLLEHGGDLYAATFQKRTHGILTEAEELCSFTRNSQDGGLSTALFGNAGDAWSPALRYRYDEAPEGSLARALVAQDAVEEFIAADGEIEKLRALGWGEEED